MGSSGLYCIVVAFLISISTARCESVCNRIEISDTTYQQEREGTYVLMTEHGCGDKPSWKQEQGPNYIFEFELFDQGIHDRWLVGPKYCSVFVGLQAPVTDSWDTPLDINPSDWLEFSSLLKAWQPATMVMTCIQREPEACRFGEGPTCALQCHCADSTCDIQSGECATGCEGGLPNPPTHAWKGQACQTGNVAVGKQASQTGSPVQDSSQAVDGNSTSTCLEVDNDPTTNEAVLKVDLVDQHTVSEFIIYHRQSPASSGQIAVGVSDQADLSADFTECGTYAESTVGKSPVTVQCATPVNGRYATVRRTGGPSTASLSLCEVVVIGQRYMDCSSCPGSCDDISGCDSCPAGRKLPDCQQSCTGGTYGENCKYKCGWCLGGCDPVSGACTCIQWWVGHSCKTYIESLVIAQKDIQIDEVTASTAVVHWQKIYNVPPGLHTYYKYEVQYKLQDSEVWMNGPLVVHDPDEDPSSQEKQLTGLRANTRYDVKIKSYRVDGLILNATSETPAVAFHTECGEPVVPPLQIVHSITVDDKVTFRVTWKAIAAEDYGCVSLSSITLTYKDVSAVDWTRIDVPTTRTSQTVGNLTKADYIFRLTVTNDADLSAVSETRVNVRDSSEEKESSESDLNLGVIVGAAVGGLVFIVIVLLVIFVIVRLTRRTRQPTTGTGTNPPGHTNIIVYPGSDRVVGTPPVVGAETYNYGPSDKPRVSGESDYETVNTENFHYQALGKPTGRH